MVRLADCFLEIFGYVSYLIKGPDPLDPPYETALQDLDRLLAQSKECCKRGGFSNDDFSEARFAVCAWVDEAILCSSWEGRTEWIKEPLQRRFYNTTNAGEDFFKRLGGLDEERAGVREVYALCLGLGFSGRYYQEDQKSDLEEVKRSNIRLLLGDVLEDLGLTEKDLFPGAYPSGEISRRRPRLGWSSLFTFIFLAIPAALLAALFLYYRFFLDQILTDFFGSVL